MASTPEWKVYTQSNEYVAACKYVEDAAAIIAAYGNGSTIRAGHREVVWREGEESQPAAESYDFVRITVTRRTSGKAPMPKGKLVYAEKELLEYVCSCGHSVFAHEPPPPQPWSDGHVCHFTKARQFKESGS